MSLQLTSTTYMTLCALLRDALLVPSDATPVLTRAAQELAHIPLQALPADLRSDKKRVAALQQAGFAAPKSMGQMTARPVTCP